MNTYTKVHLIVFTFTIITIILNYIIDWNLTRNGFSIMMMWGVFLLLGLGVGRELTIKEMEK